MNLVLQKHSKGCGIACASMLTGRDYGELYRELFGTLGKVHGMYKTDIESICIRAGLRIGENPKRIKGEFSRDIECAPFADMHIVEVHVFCDSEMSHFCVMDADGKICDPIFGHPDIHFYSEVYTITGVWRAK